MKQYGLVTVPMMCLAMAGCMNFSGLSGSKKEFQCKAPDGVLCTSVSGIYANSLEDNLPALKLEKANFASSSQGKERAQASDATDTGRTFSPRALDAPNSGDPLRIPPLVLRVWVAPWEDADGDFNDQQYIYTVVHNGRWMVETNRENIRNQFKPAFPLRKPKPETGNESESAAEAVAADGMSQGRNTSVQNVPMGSVK